MVVFEVAGRGDPQSRPRFSRVVPAKSDLIDKPGVVLFPSIPLRGPIVRSLTAFFASFRSRAALQLEILALRHQLGVLQRSVKQPKLTPVDPLLWAWLCAVLNDWQSSVVSADSSVA
jgi:hypothetical protein